jgi:hypothetical protein
LLAAQTQEFDETTADNVEEGKQSIALVFNDQPKDMRPLRSRAVRSFCQSVMIAPGPQEPWHITTLYREGSESEQHI